MTFEKISSEKFKAFEKSEIANLSLIIGGKVITENGRQYDCFATGNTQATGDDFKELTTGSYKDKDGYDFTSTLGGPEALSFAADM
jgi:hypothetical protein